jgi:5-methylcytosine-specific restriction endonuclease McrA
MARKLRTRKQRRAAIRDGYRMGLRMTSREEYRQYLAGAWWQTRRRQKLASAGYRCEGCKAAGVVLHVHHRHYLTLGREKNADLEALCEPCHRAKHPNWEGA